MILVLGGTTEGRSLATALGDDAVISLAGLVRSPTPSGGRVRVGGFGGVAGLIRWLEQHRPAAVLDATHPFSAQMSSNAVTAAGFVGIPLLRIQRPGWIEQPRDRWTRVNSATEAADLLPTLGSRVLLTTGRLELKAFAQLDLTVVLRSVQAPDPPLPKHLTTLLERGPWSLEHERLLLREHAIEVVVTKDSGGPTAAKLTAARELGIPVVMIDRPAASGAEQVETVDQALDWLSGQQHPTG